MIQQAPPQERLAEDGPSQGHAPGSLAELVLDSYRVTGRIQHEGAPRRRLVDILNAVDRCFLVVNQCEVDDPMRPERQLRRFSVMHVERNGILLAVPREGSTAPSLPHNVVTKIQVRATIVLSGLEVSGIVHLSPDDDPNRVPLLAGDHFIPMTDATVVPAKRRAKAWREPLVVVNLARALAYAPSENDAD
jgi:hypothetical protein